MGRKFTCTFYKVRYNEVIQKLTDPRRVGFCFVGWSLSEKVNREFGADERSNETW